MLTVTALEMANTTVNTTLAPEYHLPMPWSSVSSVLAVLGIAGNVLIILSTLIKRHIKSTSSVLIAILALFDLGSNVGMCMVRINVA